MLSAIGIAIKHCPVTGRPPCSPFGPLPIAALNGALRALIRPAAREYFRAVPDAEPAQDAAAFGIGGPFPVLGARSCSHVPENSAASNHGSSPVAITTTARAACIARSTRI